MSPAGRTWGVNNKAGSLSNPETGVTESGNRREKHARQAKQIHQEKRNKEEEERNPKVANRIKVHQAQIDRRENQGDFPMAREQIFISRQEEMLLPDPAAFSRDRGKRLFVRGSSSGDGVAVIDEE